MFPWPTLSKPIHLLCFRCLTTTLLAPLEEDHFPVVIMEYLVQYLIALMDS